MISRKRRLFVGKCQVIFRAQELRNRFILFFIKMFSFRKRVALAFSIGPLIRPYPARCVILFIIPTKFFAKPRVSKDSSPFSGRVIEFALLRIPQENAHTLSAFRLALGYQTFRRALNPFCAVFIPPPVYTIAPFLRFEEVFQNCNNKLHRCAGSNIKKLIIADSGRAREETHGADKFFKSNGATRRILRRRVAKFS